MFKRFSLAVVVATTLTAAISAGATAVQPSITVTCSATTSQVSVAGTANGFTPTNGMAGWVATSSARSRTALDSGSMTLGITGHNFTGVDNSAALASGNLVSVVVSLNYNVGGKPAVMNKSAYCTVP